MQNFELTKKQRNLTTIYLSKKSIKNINLRSEKKLLRHYLCAVEQGTRETFFNKFPFRVNFQGVHRNSIGKLIKAHEELGTLGTTRGARNEILYKFPENYPSSTEKWLQINGGYIKIERDELLFLLDTLEDNELRVYFALLLINEAQKDLGQLVETFPKVLRERHLNFSQKTLKKALDGLSVKELLNLSIPICPQKRFFNRFMYSLKKFGKKFDAQKEEGSCTRKTTEDHQLHKNSAELKENYSTRNYLNQDALNQKEKQKTNKRTDFNFYGLDSIDRPLTKATVRNLMNNCSLTENEIQESVRRFSEFVFSHEENLNLYQNPVGFLVSHMKKFNQIFIEPEWWIERKGKVHLGRERFRKDFNLDTKRANEQSIQSTLSKILNSIEIQA